MKHLTQVSLSSHGIRCSVRANFTILLTDSYQPCENMAIVTLACLNVQSGGSTNETLTQTGLPAGLIALMPSIMSYQTPDLIQGGAGAGSLPNNGRNLEVVACFSPDGQRRF